MFDSYLSESILARAIKEKKIKDPVINEKFNTYKFSDYKDYVITLLQKMITVSLNTNEIIEKMRDESQQI